MRRGVTVHFRDVASRAPEMAADEGLTLEVSPAMSPHDEVVFLLHTAAEIEHSLMVQYLYAAWSLSGDAGMGRWRRAILQIAREEMAHFVDVQNLLRFVGGPLNFDREDFPFRTDFYPFPFRLERLHRRSLALYVAAEMPARPNVDPDLIAEVLRLVGDETGDETGDGDGAGDAARQVNRVGVLYNRLAELFADEDRLPDSVFRPDTADDLQAHPARFRADVGRGPLYLRTVSTRAEALALLADVATQGEGEVSVTGSHFLTFLDIFDRWPAGDDDAFALDVPTNPAIGDGISHPRARDWAVIFDHHYRMLLGWLHHALLTRAGPTATGLALRAFDEMFVLSDVGPFLTTLPRTAEGTGRAGAPFGLPFTLALPDRPSDRWALHQDLIDAARSQIAALDPPASDAEDEIRRRILGSLTAAATFVAEHAGDDGDSR
jgi:hypothetical protein